MKSTAMFGERVFQQTVGIPMGTNCVSLYTDLFIYWYEEHFMQRILGKNDKMQSLSFNFTFRYTDDVLSQNNSPTLVTLLILSITKKLK